MTTLEYVNDNLCLAATVGSIAYGLNHATSDVDTMAVFVSAASEVAGLDWRQSDNSWANNSPEGDDLTAHEIGKYLRLCLNGNPTLIELLFMEEYTILTSVGQGILDIREHLMGESILRSSYHGYAHSQLVRVINAGPDSFKPKMARHTLRIARQGISLMETGEFSVRVEDPQEYFDLTDLPYLDMLKKIVEPIEQLKTCKSILPAEANRPAVVDFLRTVRYEYP